ncbi:MAG TPA: OsmC family protein [Acetobacteraceae bacterium]
MTKGPIPAAGSVLTPIAKPELDALIAKGKADPTAIRTLRCRTVATGRFHQLNYIRNLPPQPVMEVEPEGLLGEDIAPNASEALLAAFGSCLAVGIHANAVARRIPIRRLQLELEADINTTAVWGTGDIDPKPIGFEAVRVSVELDADAPREALDALIKHATLWSPVANTLHNPVHLDVALAQAVHRVLPEIGAAT